MQVETALQGAFETGGPVLSRLEQLAAAARKIEALGFDGATTPEVGHDPFLPFVIGAEHTERIYLCSSVAIAFPRSPMVMAQIAWDLQRFSGGRFRLGIGSQVKANNERRYSTPWTGPPGPRMREYILCLRAIFKTFQNGAKPTFFTGQHYQFTMLQPAFNPYYHHGPMERPHIPIYVAAVNPYMARLAGELCDGIRPPGWITDKYFKKALLPAIEEGARKAGRQLSDIDIVGGGMFITGKDEGEIEATRRKMREFIAFWGSTRTYHAMFEAHGEDWVEIGRRLHRLSVEGRWHEMPDLITDEMLEEIAPACTYDELAPRLKKMWGGVCTTLSLPHWIPVSEERMWAMIQELRQPCQLGESGR